MRFRGLLILLAGCLSLVSAQPAWARPKLKVLYRFAGTADGANPSSSLVLDAAGNLYGTTWQAGKSSNCNNYGCGTVFELMPLGNGHWRRKVLHSFQSGTDGAYPSGNLVFDASGNLYGTTTWGGTPGICKEDIYQGCGTVFELSPNADASWTETVLYRFQGYPDVSRPAGLVFDAAGNLYGTSAGVFATVYELLPPQRKGGTWTEQILYTFEDCCEWPNAGLVLDSHGNLFGTTQVEICEDTCGQVFELALVNGDWVETSFYQFPGGGNGSNPEANVILDAKGNLYGTTYQGGNNYGVVFELKPAGVRQWIPSLLYNFCSTNNCADGAHPVAGLVFDKAGSLYGTARDGGKACYKGGCGIVFRLEHTKRGWRQTVLHRFVNDPDGAKPTTNLILDSAGNIYGTTYYGGEGYGAVFEIVP